MNLSNEFLRLMAAHQDLALATSVDNTPHVRIVNFVYAGGEKARLLRYLSRQCKSW